MKRRTRERREYIKTACLKLSSLYQSISDNLLLLALEPALEAFLLGWKEGDPDPVTGHQLEIALRQEIFAAAPEDQCVSRRVNPSSNAISLTFLMVSAHRQSLWIRYLFSNLIILGPKTGN